MSVADVEKRLAEYRAQKEREAKISKYKSKVKNVFGSIFRGINRDPQTKMGFKPAKPDLDSHLIPSKPECDRLSYTDSEFDEEDDSVRRLSSFDYVYYVLSFILWAIVYAIFVKLQFGTIYFILSLLVGIYLNTRTGPKQRNEVSAYSVFNKNCESIDGTLKAEDLERQMLYGGFR